MYIEYADNVKYTGFESSVSSRIPTKKPNVDNFYVKDTFKDIADYGKRKVEYLENGRRWESQYGRDSNTRRNASLEKKSGYGFGYKNGGDLKSTSGEQHDDTMKKIIEDLSNKNSKNELLSSYQFTTTYRDNNRNLQKSIEKIKEKDPNLLKTSLPNLYQAKERVSHNRRYQSEYSNSYGQFKDEPRDKFHKSIDFNSSIKRYYDNYELSIGSSKASSFMNGYTGHIPINDYTQNKTIDNDHFAKNFKVNLLDNFNKRIPHYTGHVIRDAGSYKGNIRPFCLSTKGETYN